MNATRYMELSPNSATFLGVYPGFLRKISSPYTYLNHRLKCSFNELATKLLDLNVNEYVRVCLSIKVYEDGRQFHDVPSSLCIKLYKSV